MNKSIKVALIVFNALTHLKIIFKFKNTSDVILMLISDWIEPRAKDNKELTIAKEFIRTMFSEDKKNIW